MKRLNTRFAVLALVVGLTPALSGCELLDKLKARDELNKGVRAYTSQNYKAATDHFNESIKLDPELTAARLYLATTYRVQFVPGIPSEENLGRAETAIKIFKEVLEEDPGNINAIASIAGLYDGLDKPELAKDWYRKRAELEPNNPEPYYGIGTIDYKQVSLETGQNGDNVENLTPEKRQELAALVDSGVESLLKALKLKPTYADAAQFLNLLYRERSYLATDEEEKKRWQKEADKLALQALELKRKEEEEVERARRSFTGKTSEGN